MAYTEDFLISELQRFYSKNSRVPIAKDMIKINGYPSYMAYVRHFKTWNNALEIAELPLNQYQDHWQDGTETCCKCGEYLKQGQNWHTKGLPKGEVMCFSCYQNNHANYMNNKLSKESSVGKATISQRVVFNVFNLEEKYDCNCEYGFKYFVDLYHKNKYKYINVKDSALYYREKQNLFWQFKLTQAVTPDTYVMLGYDEDRKNILRVWITDAIDDLVFNEKTETLKKFLFIANISESLKRAKPWEVDAKPYNDMLHKMSEKRKETNGKGCFLRDDDLVR